VLFQYNSTCCTLEVVYCVRFAGNKLDIKIIDFTMKDLNCWGLDAETPPPIGINTVLNQLRKVIIRDEFPGNLNNCYQWSQIIVGVETATCARWEAVVISPPGEPAYLSWQAQRCSDLVCYRECQVCLSMIETDPCTGLPIIEFGGCTVYPTPCSGDPIELIGCENLCVS
jgi:hypothetical protein